MRVLLALYGLAQCQAANTAIPADEVTNDVDDASCSLMLLQQGAATATAARIVEARESPFKQLGAHLSDIIHSEVASDFAGRPAEDTWPARWKEAVRKGTDQPCAAEVISFVAITNNRGIGSVLHGRILEYMLALYSQLGLSMLSDSHYNQKVFEKNFENSAGISVCQKYVPGQKGGVLFAAQAFTRQLGEQQPDYAKRLMRFVAPYVLTYKADVQAELDRRLTSMGLGAVPYVGVHIRHGDKAKEAALVPTSKYTDRVRQVEKQQDLLQASIEIVRTTLEQTGARIVFLATEDASAVAEMQQALGSDVEVKVQTGVDYGRDYDQGEALMDLLTDLEGLRRSDVFICTGSSNVAKIVYAMRPGKPNDEDIVDLEGDPTFPLHFAR